jgi:hypothetical protein
MNGIATQSPRGEGTIEREEELFKLTELIPISLTEINFGQE